jgi:hypothetical protein
VSPVDVDVDASLTRPHCGLESRAQCRLDQPARGRCEAEEAEGVGEQTGRHEDRCGDQDDDAVHDRAGRDPAVLQLPSDGRQDRQALPASQRGAQDSRGEDEAERGERADSRSDLDQERQLDGRNGHEEDQQREHDRGFGGPRGSGGGSRPRRLPDLLEHP